jgi:hypothetical protein
LAEDGVHSEAEVAGDDALQQRVRDPDEEDGGDGRTRKVTTEATVTVVPPTTKRGWSNTERIGSTLELCMRRGFSACGRTARVAGENRRCGTRGETRPVAAT